MSSEKQKLLQIFQQRGFNKINNTKEKNIWGIEKTERITIAESQSLKFEEQLKEMALLEPILYWLMFNIQL